MRSADYPSPQAARSARILDIAQEVGELCEAKNRAYGSSFETSAEFLKLLFPDGIRPEQYLNVLLLARIYDKLGRIATDTNAFDEDPFKDLVGYGILGCLTKRGARYAAEDAKADQKEVSS